MNLRWINAETVEDGALQDSLSFIAPLRERHEERGQHEQPQHVKDERLSSEAVEDEKNRPDDEQHERDDAQQLVQFGALLQERRKQLLKVCHTSGRFEFCLPSREGGGRVHQAERLAVLLHGLGEFRMFLLLLRLDLSLRVVTIRHVLHEG